MLASLTNPSLSGSLLHSAHWTFFLGSISKSSSAGRISCLRWNHTLGEEGKYLLLLQSRFLFLLLLLLPAWWAGRDGRRQSDLERAIDHRRMHPCCLLPVPRFLVYRRSEWVRGHLGPSQFQEPRRSVQVLSTHRLCAKVLTTATQIASHSSKPGSHA